MKTKLKTFSLKYHQKGIKDKQKNRTFTELSPGVLKVLHALYTKYTFLLSTLNC